jgi:hypothetical protein
MYRKSDEGLTQFQLFGSFLGFLLPILQFFFNLVPATGGGTIFLIRDNFLFISIFAALFSYILIIIARSYIWFEVAINRRAHKKWQEHLARQDGRVFDLTEIQDYLKGKPFVKKPFYITPANVFTATLPITVISFLSFFALGLTQYAKDGVPANWAIFLQGIFYILLIAFTTLTLAIYYIRDLNAKRLIEDEKARVSNVIKLAYEANAFLELPHINLIAQWSLSQNVPGQYLFLFQVGSRFYKLITDAEINKIETVEPFDNYDSMINSLSTTNQQGSNQ